MAVKTLRYQFTYAELNRAANQIARAILALCGPQTQVIALCFEPDAQMILAVLAIIKTGKCHIILDPSSLFERNLQQLDDAQIEIILANRETLDLARSYAAAHRQILNIDELDLQADSPNLELAIPPDAPIRLVYTSGSTGQPKGVVQNQHDILHNAINYSNAIHICTEDRLLFHSRIAIGPILRALLSGSTLYPFDIKRHSFGVLAEWMAQEEITILVTVPTVLLHLTESLDGTFSFPHLRIITMNGEALYRHQVEEARRFFPETILFNLLGSRESNGYRIYFVDQHTPIQGDRLPAGYALPGTEIMLLDEANRPVSPGEVGEIVVKSQYLSTGYWRRPDLTAEKFMADPAGGSERLYFTGDLGQLMPDGLLLYHGRKDFQVKIRGFQVKLDQVESIISNLESVNHAAVVARDDAAGVLRLIAYVVTDRKNVTASSLRRQLAAILPDYMIPSTFVFLDALPLTSLGKIDRRALPPPGSARPLLDSPFVAPRTPAEASIAAIWADVLDMDEVGILDPFLDLGGHSLQATQIVTRVLDTFQVDLPPRILFESATVASMAELLIHHQLQQLSSQEAEELVAALESLPEERV
ncbi:MAG: non-ribosomal peptide synthetase [Caldilineaceae bacterium]|nr:non-ribosomal peptide synthetase [Caldilineaceae bacterium]